MYLKRGFFTPTVLLCSLQNIQTPVIHLEISVNYVNLRIQNSRTVSLLPHFTLPKLFQQGGFKIPTNFG